MSGRVIRSKARRSNTPETGRLRLASRPLMRLAVLLGMFAGIGCAQVTPEKELAMGLRLVADLESRQEMVSEPAVTRFLDGVVRALTRGEQTRIPLQLRVVTTADNVASALPGGFLLLSSGALG